MTQRLPLLVLALFVGFAAGCCGREQRVWQCDDGQCGQGVLSGRFEGCSDCGECDQCGQPAGNCGCGLLSRLGRRLTCGEGCGELYWGDWISDPPAPCDPCDECTGQFLGRRCCPPKHTMCFGGRFCDAGCPSDACTCQGALYAEEPGCAIGP